MRELNAGTKAEILEYLIAGRETDWLVERGYRETDVTLVKRDHGYPDPEKMKWAKSRLEKADAVAAPRPTPQRPSTVTTTQPQIAVAPLPEQLVVRAKASSKASTRHMGERLGKLIAQVVAALDAEAVAARAAAAKAREEQRRREEIAQLEAKLAELRAGKTAHHSTTPELNARIRAWAAESDVHCPPKGRIPGEVRRQYLAAQEAVA